MFVPNIPIEHSIIQRAIKLINEVNSILELGSKRLDPLQIEILVYIAAHPGCTAYKIYREKVLPWKEDLRWINNQIPSLADIGLILRTQVKGSHRKKLSLRLTTLGLVVLFLQKHTLYKSAIREILLNYRSNVVFQLFVYPHIKQSTLRQLSSLNSLLPLSLFLYECCAQLSDAVNTTINTKNEFVTRELFVWQSIPNDSCETSKLIEFMKKEFNLKWIDHATFEKIENDNVLRVAHKSNSIIIRLNDTKSKASLTTKGKVKYEFMVKEFGKTYENSKGYFGIEIPIMTVKEWAANFLITYVRSRVPSFMFNLMQSITVGSDDFRSLSKDERFLDILEKIKTDFNIRYERLTKIR